MPNNAMLHPLFAVNPELWNDVSKGLRSKSYKNNDSIILHGDAASGFWLVLSGWVKLTRQTPDGKEIILGLCTQGDVFGEAALFAHANYAYTAEVVSADASLAVIPATVMRSIVAKDSLISAHVMALLNERTAQAQLRLEHLTTMSAAQRLGCFFLRLCQGEDQGSKILTIPVEKHVLAAYLGMKPETLSRTLQQLHPLGVIVSGHEVTISDVRRLNKFVCNSCSESGSCDFDAGG